MPMASTPNFVLLSSLKPLLCDSLKHALCFSDNAGAYDPRIQEERNAFVTEAFEHRTFFTRLHQFVLASDAFLVAPGGIGTVLETMMIWQLLQVRHLQDTPLILVGAMWPGLIEWARCAMLAVDPPLAHPEDLTIPRCAANAEEAIALIREHHSQWLNAHQP
jgi:predicted Rossmann-fold nucleotide-binding protein